MDTQMSGGVAPDERPVYRVGALRTVVSAANIDGKCAVVDTGTTAIAGDTIRFESGTWAAQEFQVVASVTNGFTLSRELNPVPSTDDFYVLRKISQRVAADGTSSASLSTTAYLDSARHDYAATPVTNAAWTQLVASSTGTATKITLFDGGGYAMELGIGAGGAETRCLLIPPGGFNGMIECNIPVGSRISVKAIGAASVDAGEIDINFFG